MSSVIFGPPSATKVARWRDLARLNYDIIMARRIRHTGAKLYYVYILLNEAKTRTYTGVSSDVDKRLAEHNAGRVKASSAYRPYKIIHTESFKTLREARQKEIFYKSTTGRRKLKEIIFKFNKINSIAVH